MSEARHRALVSFMNKAIDVAEAETVCSSMPIESRKG
jgi:hypothetical protein